MRPIDALIQSYTVAGPATRSWLLARVGRLSLDFELPELIDFLTGASLEDDPAVRRQALRALRNALPRLAAHRYRDRQPSSVDRPDGTWTEYNIDRTELDAIRRLGDAQRLDLAALDRRRLVSAAVHVLLPCIDAAADLARTGTRPIRRLAVEALGAVPAAPAVRALVDAASDRELLGDVAASLADHDTPMARAALVGLLDARPDAPSRNDLIIELGRMGGDEAYAAVVRQLLDATAATRAAVAQALAGFATSDAETILRELAADRDELVRLHAADALACVGTAASVDVLRTLAARSTDPVVRQSAVRALGALGEPAGRDPVTAAMSDPDPGVRAQAVESLVRLRIPDQELFGLAFPLVRDPSAAVASHAILALAPIDGSLAIQRVMALLRDPDPATRARGAWCLGYVQHPSALALLGQVASQEPAETVVVQAVKAHAKYEPAEVTESLTRLLTHRGSLVRRTAAAVLTSFGSAPGLACSRAAATALPQERDAGVAVALVGLLAVTSTPAQHLVLAHHLGHRVPEVVAAVVEGLDLLANIESVPALTPLTASPHPCIKARAALALWHQGELRVVDRLRDDLKGGDEHQVTGALEALRQVGLSLRRLEDPSRYPLLAAELHGHASTAAFATHEASVPSGALPEPAATIRRAGPGPIAFEFTSTVLPAEVAIDTSLPPPEGEPSGELDEEALADLFTASAGEPGPEAADETVERALVRWVEGDAPGAQAILDALIAGSDCAVARFVRARIHMAAHRYDDAELDLASASAADPDFINPVLTLVGLRQQRRAKPEMVAAFAAAVERSLALLGRQTALLRELLHRSADDLLPLGVKELRHHLPEMEALHRSAGILKLAAGEDEAAFRELFKAHAADPFDGEVSLKLARAAARSDRAAFARGLCARLSASPSADEKVRAKVREILASLPADPSGRAR